MNIKKLSAILLAGGLLASGAASAAPLCSTFATTGAWSGSCIDADGDMLFTLQSSTIPGTTGFNVGEALPHVYDVGFNWGNQAYTGGGVITYTVTSLLPSYAIDGVNLDTTVIVIEGETTKATKDVYGISGALLASLTSTNGSHDPLSGETPIGPTSFITVVDTFIDATGNAVYTHADNSIRASAIPEPSTLMLLGLGLAGFGFMRRRKA